MHHLSLLFLLIFITVAGFAQKKNKPQHVSENILKIIPADPNYIPTVAQQQQTKIFLSKIYKANEIEISVADTVEFIDQGENFESVACNICGKEISIEAWQDQMDKAHETQFQNLKFETPCHHQTSLNDLTYVWPAGFAKVVIAISDTERKLTEGELNQLQSILGSKLRVILAQY